MKKIILFLTLIFTTSHKIHTDFFDSRTYIIDPVDVAHSVAWSPNGKYFTVSGYNTSGDNLIIYEWDNSNLTQKDSVDISSGEVSIFGLKWNPTGNHLAIDVRIDLGEICRLEFQVQVTLRPRIV